MPSRLLVDNLRHFFRNDQFLLWGLAMVVGVAAGYASLAFRMAIDLMQLGSFGATADQLVAGAASVAWWRVLLVPTAGGLAIGLFIHYVMPERRPRGVADAIEAAALRAGHMSGRAGLGAALVNAASIGVGASVGREGPVVHIGAVIGSWLAKNFGLSRSVTVTLLGCGVASAISASFNAPIAGVFFALEVVIGHYALTAFAPIVLASVIGTLVSRGHFGPFPAFLVPEHGITSFYEFPAFALLGVVCAIAAVAMLRSIALVDRLVRRVPVPAWARPMGAGLLVGLIALAFPHVLGVGYGATDAVLNGAFPLWLIVALAFAKTAATAISLGAGFGGGIFSPSLFVGAMVGSAFGIIATSALPELSSGIGAYALVGMGAVAGAVLGAPISTILIIFELTGDYAITIAVMVGVVIASVITRQVAQASYFSWQLDRRGIVLRGGRTVGLLSALRVRDVMRGEFESVQPGLGMKEVRSRLYAAPHGELFVVDEGGRLEGTITLTDLSDAAFDTSMDHLLNASDVARRHPPVLEPGDDLDAAIQRMEAVGEEHLAVVADQQSMRLIGFVHEVDVMSRYNRALLQARAEERGEI